jgi:hypothetical protein
MEKLQRKTASEIQKEVDLIKEQVIHSIKEIIEEKQIKYIYLDKEYQIMSYDFDDDNYFVIREILSDGVREYENVIIHDFIDKTFEELELSTLTDILNLLEGDISEIKI